MRAHRLPNPSTAFSCGNTRSSTAIHGIVLRDVERAAARIRLSAGSWVKMAPSHHGAAQCRHAQSRACVLLWAPAHACGARVDGEGCRSVSGTVRHRKASPRQFYLAAAMTRALPATVESARYIRLRTSVLPWLRPGRWGAAPHWVSAAFIHLSTILRVRGRISNPPPPLPTPSITASDPHFLSLIIATAGPQVPLLGAQPWPPLRPW